MHFALLSGCNFEAATQRQYFVTVYDNRIEARELFTPISGTTKGPDGYILFALVTI